MSVGDASGGDTRSLGVLIDRLLLDSGYRRVPELKISTDSAIAAYEDPLSIVAVRIFTTLPELIHNWIDTQDRVVDLVTGSLASIDAKAWDGYVILATDDRVPAGALREVQEIAGDTRRIRKLVVTGDDLVGGSSIDLSVALRRSLASLLPLHIEVAQDLVDPLQNLPSRLDASGISAGDTRILLEAYRDGRPMVGALHAGIGDAPAGENR